MTVSIRRVTLGHGYRYLMESVAQSDGAHRPVDALTAYYTDTGTPPGRFLGRGLAGLGDEAGVEAGSVVSEEHLFRMLGMLQDPLTGAQLGTFPPSQELRHQARVQARIYAETAHLAGPERVEAVARIRAEEGAAEAKRPKVVAGFDLTFSAPKSVSVAWALADHATRNTIYAAHQRALAFVVFYAEECVFTSRSGKGGVVQEDVKGIVAAAFDHWDSRAGDPQLHTHVVVLNRAQTLDGRWRTLDSRGLFKATVALSELYNAALSDYLTAELGWGWEPVARRHSGVPKYEVAGVPQELREVFSSRSAAIEDAVADLVARFRTERGRAPTSREVLQLRQQATLATRPDKQVHPLAELVARWRSEAAPLLGRDGAAWVGSLAGRNTFPLQRGDQLSEQVLAEVAALTVEQVAGKRATFSRANVLAEALRQLHEVRFTSPQERVQAVHRTVELALAHSVPLTPPELAHTPAKFVRPDGTSRFRARGHEVYTTSVILEAEARLVEAGRDTTGPVVPTPALGTGTSLAAIDRRRLPSAEQQAAVRLLAGSGRVVDVLVGPAGTGKSATMAGLRAAWESHYGAGSVLGLAPSANAAQVLSAELGVGCENTVKWLFEHARNPERRAQVEQLRQQAARTGDVIRADRLRHAARHLAGEARRWGLRAGQLVILDEASLAPTHTLDALAGHARRVGAKLVLVGDWAQLSPVEAGGVFHLLVHDRHDRHGDQQPLAELTDARRFIHDWEKTASVRLRHGDSDALDAYAARGRVTGGDREAMLDAAYTAWHQDTAAGKTSLMVAGDAATVAELNARARTDRLLTGQVAAGGVRTGDGVTIGVGDHVVTRRNDRHLTTGAGWVKNGDRWTVTAAHPDGSLTVARGHTDLHSDAGREVGAPGGRTGGAVVTLPPPYVAEHLELGYATTAHRAQGRTVDTAHAVVSAASTREALYVAATRGREANRVYVDTAFDPDVDTAHGTTPARDPVEVLRGVLATPSADTAASQALEQAWQQRHGIATVWAEYTTIAAAACRGRYDSLLASCGLQPHELAAVRTSPAYGALLGALREADGAGLNVATAFPRLVQGRPLDGADDVAAVLHGRLQRWKTAAGGPDPGARRIAGLFPTAPPIADPDIQQALDERAALIHDRARHLAALAVQRQDAWVRQLGGSPADPERRQAWYRQLVTVAAYRDRWHITSDRQPFGGPPTNDEQASDLHRAQGAAHAALDIHRQAAWKATQERHPVPQSPEYSRGFGPTL